MKLFIWKELEEVTSSWHTEAALVVIAASLQAANVLIANNEEIKPDLKLPKPDATFELVGEPEPSVIVFPNKGCC